MQVLRRHYPEYLMEAAELGMFMMSAAIVTTIFEHPASLIHQAIPDLILRRFLIGLAMGCTAIAVIYSPWGQRSGAHINPVVTLTFWRLGKVKRWDALFYIVCQFIGGLLGLLGVARVLGAAIAAPSVNYIVTIPGSRGALVAFVAEMVISFGMMLMILLVSNHSRLSRYTGLFAALFIATYITLEAPLSGMSMNPARTLASAIAAHEWTDLWVYFTAPLLGMLSAAEVYVRVKGHQSVRCAKLHHHNRQRCIFRCGYRQDRLNHPSLELSDRLPHSPH